MEILPRLIRITLLSLGILFGIVINVVLFVVIYFGKPYIAVTEIRSSSEPKTVKVRWYLSCEEEYYEDENEKFYDPQVPVGGVSPGVLPVRSSNTEFVLVGYPYRELHKNIFTGSVNEERSERFDVIEWHVVTPYTTLEGEEYIESNKPLEWTSGKTEVQFFTQFYRSRKGGC